MTAVAKVEHGSGSIVRPAADYEGLRRAAYELLDAGFCAADDERVRRLAMQAANAEAVLAGLPQRHTMAEGYYVRVAYLWDLEEMMRAGLQFAPADVTADEWRGLRAVDLGRKDWERNHARCPQCGGFNSQVAHSCRWCKKEFTRQ